MPTPLRVLLLEDHPADSELMLRELRLAGYDPDWRRIESEEAFLDSLDEPFELILADFSLPQFDALAALRHLRERGLDIPLVVVTGSISEEAAVECMRQGAADYLLKDRLARLGRSAANALEQRQLRRAKLEAELALRQSEERFRRLAENAADLIYRYELREPVGFSYVSPAANRIIGYSPEEHYADPFLGSKILHPEDLEKLQAALQPGAPEGEPLVLRWSHRDGRTVWIEQRNVLVRDARGAVVAVEGIARDVTERERVEQELRAREQRLQALHDLALATSGIMDPRQLAENVVMYVRDLLEADGAAVCVWNEARGGLELLAESDSRGERGPRTSVPGKGVVGYIFDRGEPVLVADYPSWEHATLWGVERGLRAVAGVPLRVRERTLGALVVRSYTARELPADTVQFLSLCAGLVGPALEAARLYDESERRRQEAEALAELARQGTGARDPDELMGLITQLACRLLDADYSGIFLEGEDGNWYWRALWGGTSGEPPAGTRLRGDGPAIEAIREQRTVLVEDLQRHPAYVRGLLRIHRAAGGRTLITCPLLGRDVVLGALSIGWREITPLSRAQVALAEALAGHAATVLDNARAHAEANRHAREAAARASELAAVLEQMPSGVLVVDPHGRVRLMNAVAREISGGNLDRTRSIVGLTRDYQARDPSTGAPIALGDMPIARALRGERVERFETIIRAPGGEQDAWLQTSAIPLTDSSGEIGGALAVIEDVTWERTLLREMAASEARLRSVHESMACGVVVWDRTSTAVHANSTALDILGVEPEQLIGVRGGTRLRFLREDGVELIPEERPFRVAMRTGRPVRQQTMRVERPDGQHRWILVDAVPLADQGGAALEVVSSFVDITARRRAEEQLWEAAERYRLVSRATNDAIWDWDLGTGRVTWNAAVRALFGYDFGQADVIETPIDWWADRLHPEDAARVLDGIHAVFDRGDSWSDEYRFRRADGTYSAVLDRGYVLRDEQGRAIRMVGSMLDLSERKQAEETLATSERRFRALVEHSADGVVLLDPHGQIVYRGPSSHLMLGYGAEGLVGRPFFELLHPEDAAGVMPLFRRLVGGEVASASVECRVRHVDGNWRWIEAHGTNLLAEPGVGAIVVNYRDVSERRAVQEALEHQAVHDALTGLPNRTLLHDRLGQTILAAQRDQGSFALLVMDLDRFKEINDTLGHHAGDLLLQQVGERLRTALRASDTVARLGGDEFAVVLPQTAMDGAIIAATKIMAALEEPFVLEGRSVSIEGSVGIVIYPEDGEDTATLLRRADVAMYQAKRAHSGYSVYQAELDQYSADRLAMIGELRRAIEQDELRLYYQPRVELRTGRVVGVEGLVRWQHPLRGMVPPDQFIPLAEETGLIEPLTGWVLRAALANARDWRQQGLELEVAVNLSMRNLQDSRTPDLVAAWLERWGVEPEWLALELTETAVMSDPERTKDTIHRLRSLGLRIVIDDFGTGYSSLGYLKQLPVQQLKIDRSFVHDMAGDQNDLAIVRATVELAHNLGLGVTAEGVENQRTWDQLVALGCDSAQGYFIAPPMPLDQLMTWLAERQLAAAGRE